MLPPSREDDLCLISGSLLLHAPYLPVALVVDGHIGVWTVCKHIWEALLAWLVREEHPLVFGFVSLQHELFFFFFFEGLEGVYPVIRDVLENLQKITVYHWHLLMSQREGPG